MSIQIKICSTQEDVKLIAALADKIWHEHFTPLIGKEQVEYMVEKFQSEQAIGDAVNHQNYRYFMAFDGDRLVGYCGVQPQEKELFLSKLYMDQAYRKRGIAKSLLEQAKIYAKELGKPSIYLTVNKGNNGPIAAYLKMGFTNDESIVTDIGNGFVMDDYIMRLRLQ
ncbi:MULTISPECIES: GNAT family N-acetyltransferase [Clostridiaceae]|uniref:GNAT family N-acetyltransferase n=1 Tax=Clostridium facile TaxID=2763035 RepID=A0ABR7ITW5_9CLOT|nr:MULTISPECIES: GNAT family N-acetyltransferase [Clostridiaceae]MBC5788575.1 GNAT family N-acetyltransferase [Clostridium facile]PWM98351.1 MAG: N-acetyltransferase [Massilioclostridium sp.]